MADVGLPLYRGIRTYRDPNGRFQFRYPSDWHSFELSDERDGVMYSPEAEVPKTWFAVWSTRLQDQVVAEDMDDLREAVEEGLYQLPEVHIESRSDDLFGNMIRFERVYTFREDGAIRKRKAWMIYAHVWLFALVAQTATVDDYEYWYPMLNGCIGSFELPRELWFATDRDLAGGTTS